MAYVFRPIGSDYLSNNLNVDGDAQTQGSSVNATSSPGAFDWSASERSFADNSPGILDRLAQGGTSWNRDALGQTPKESEGFWSNQSPAKMSWPDMGAPELSLGDLRWLGMSAAKQASTDAYLPDMSTSKTAGAEADWLKSAWPDTTPHVDGLPGQRTKVSNQFIGAPNWRLNPDPGQSLGQSPDLDAISQFERKDAQAAQDDQGFTQYKPLSGYEDDYRDTPVNERPFLLFQRNGSSIQHRDMEQAAMELLQEASANKRAGLGLVGEEHEVAASNADTTSAIDDNGKDGADNENEGDDRSGNGQNWFLAGPWDMLAQLNLDPGAREASAATDAAGRTPGKAPYVLGDLRRPDKSPCGERGQCDDTVLSEGIKSRYEKSAQKAAQEHQIPMELLLAMAEQEKRGLETKFSTQAGNGVMQIQRGDYLDYLYKHGKITLKVRDYESKMIAGNMKPISDPALEASYKKAVTNTDTCFEIAAFNLRDRADRYGLEEAVRMHNQGENYRRSKDPDNATRLADIYYNEVSYRLWKYMP